MKAALAPRYGSLVMREVEKPEPAEGDVLVRVHATSLNAVDWYVLNGRPYVARPLMGAVEAEVQRERQRLRRSRRSGRGRRGRPRARRRGVRLPGWRVRGVRGRGQGGRAEAGEPLVRGGCGGAARGARRAAGPSRPRGRAARAAGPRQRRVRRRRHLRGADREGTRRVGARRLQHAERRPGTRAGRGSRLRLHPRGLHAQRRPLRRVVRQRRQPVVALDVPRARAERDGGAGRRAAESACSGRSGT